jgi:hypothetical protein
MRTRISGGAGRWVGIESRLRLTAVRCDGACVFPATGIEALRLQFGMRSLRLRVRLTLLLLRSGWRANHPLRFLKASNEDIEVRRHS